MRVPLTLLVGFVAALAPAAHVRAQQAPAPTVQPATPPAATASAAAQPHVAASDAPARAAVATAGAHKEDRSAARRRAGQRQPRHVGDDAHRSAPPAEPAGVLSLGATDITGNKELPKVMVIVPWKGSLGASGVIQPTDSLLDEVLQPVDRSVFQRRIRYYGQLNAAKGQTAGEVAPVGDSHAPR